MKLVIYRNKRTNEITTYHEVTPHCTDEAIENYNNSDKHNDKVEIVELDEIAEYFYKKKTSSIEDEAENLRGLMNDLTDIANRIDARLYDFDRWFKEECGDE